MEGVANILGIVSGLRFVAPDLPPMSVIKTAIVMQITYAVVCRIFAAQRSRATLPWLIAGFFGGVVSFIVLLVLGDREKTQPPP